MKRILLHILFCLPLFGMAQPTKLNNAQIAITSPFIFSNGDTAATKYDVRGGSSNSLQIFNVKSYGAVGDSLTNDSAALVQTIAAASVKGGTVYFPPGVYRYPGKILAITASNVHLKGAGRGASRIYFDNTDVLSIDRLVFDGGTGTNYISNVSLSDISVSTNPAVRVVNDGSQGYFSEACNVNFRGCKNFSCIAVESYNAPNYGISVTRSMDGTIRDCYSHNNVADGFHIQLNCSRISMTDCHVWDVGDDGIGIGYQGYTNDITITNCTVYRAGSRGISIMGGVTECIVTNCNVTDTWLAALWVEAASGTTSNVSFIGCTVKNGGAYNGNPNPRGGGIGCGLGLDAFNNNINNVIVSNVNFINPINGFVLAGPYVSNTGTGKVNNLQLNNNIYNGITRVGGWGVVGTNGGNSMTPTVARYPGIHLKNTVNATINGGSITGSYHEGIRIDGSATKSHKIIGTTLIGINTSQSDGVYGIYTLAGIPSVSNNTVVDSYIAGADSLTAAITDVNNTTINNVSPTGTVVVTDNFQKANGNLGGTAVVTGPGPWVYVAGGSDNTIVSNVVKAPYVSGASHADYVPTGITNMVVKANYNISTTSNTNSNVSILARMIDINNNVMVAAYYNGTSWGIGIFTKVAGTETLRQFTPVTGPTAGSSHALSVKVFGNVVTAMWDGVAVGSTYTLSAGEQTAFGAGTNAGIRIYTGPSGGDDGNSAITSFNVYNANS